MYGTKFRGDKDFFLEELDMSSKKGFLLLVALLLFVGQASACPGDFNGDGKINFQDYLLFVGVYDTSSGDANYNALMDLDGNGKIEFPDYLIFVGVYDTACEPTLTTDRAILERLYKSMNGDKWEYASHWLSDEPLDRWAWVSADSDDRVTRLALNDIPYSGSIPPELGKLSELTQLRIGKQLTGPIPPELGNLTNLIWLELSYNQLSGPIPPELGKLTNLEWLELGANQLTGSIPPELGNLTKLTWLDLGANQLSGPIPPELGSLTNLTRLDLHYNQLNGTIPPQLGKCPAWNICGLSIISSAVLSHLNWAT